MSSWWNAAILLTLARLAAIPFVVAAILSGRRIQALAIFCAAAATDLLDGALARRYHLATELGAKLDPVADKLFLSAVFLALAATGTVPWWLVWVVFSRDFVLLAGSLIAMRFLRLRRFPPSLAGKASTFLQITYTFSAMLHHAAPEAGIGLWTAALAWPVAALTVASGLHYLWRGLAQSPIRG
ncbi:MAG: CDP-alcohol phosphatidyltransferase family protein [Acidobacteria bacterium]|nr:CDP-alcohol phosphatidyltransferase family protein [Acidobacteriota bacterium]